MKIKMKNLYLFIIIIVVIIMVSPAMAITDNNITAVYFYSSTCSSCHKLSEYFDNIEDEYVNLHILKYNIYDLNNKSILNHYNELYNVSLEDEGIIPVVFIKNTYLVGDESVINNFETLILQKDDIKTKLVFDTSANLKSDIKMFLSFQTFSIFLAGLVNGINPCSMSMLIFFISLILTKSVNIMKVGIAYCIGKFISFLLLGTMFYKLLSKLNLTLFGPVLKLVTFSIISVLFIMNLKDYFAAKKEQYKNVKLQLPQKLRKLNHFLIKKLSGFTNIKFFLLASFALGFFLSFGEFLCTGQIYLATIITVYQTNESMSLQALFYLIVYVTGFVTPLILISYFLYKGKAVFLLSEFIRTRLHYIKLISAGVFFVFSILVILYY